MTVSKHPRRAGIRKILILALSFAVVAAVAALLLTETIPLRSVPGNDGERPQEEEKPLMSGFKLPRAAVGGVNCIGGSGTDRAVASFTLGDKTYTVGETDSTDLDMEGAPQGRKLFVSVSDANNTVSRIAVFGSGAADTAIDVGLAWDGIKILGQSDAKTDNLTLYTFDYTDYTVGKTPIPHIDRLLGKKLLPVGERVYVFADDYSAGTNFHRLIVYCLEGGNTRFVHTVTDAAVSYECAEVYPTASGCTALVNAREGNYTYPAIVGIEDLDYTVTPLMRREANTKIIATYPKNGGYRLLLATDAGSCLVAVDAAHAVKTLAAYPKKGKGAVLPFRKTECVVFFGEDSVCYITADGRTTESNFSETIADARPCGDNGVELLLLGDKTVACYELGNAVTAMAAAKLDTGAFGNADTVYGTMRAGMGGTDAALVRMSAAL